MLPSAITKSARVTVGVWGLGAVDHASRDFFRSRRAAWAESSHVDA